MKTVLNILFGVVERQGGWALVTRRLVDAGKAKATPKNVATLGIVGASSTCSSTGCSRRSTPATPGRTTGRPPARCCCSA